MAHSPATRLAVRDAYISGAPLALAAGRAGVSEATARGWKQRAAGSPEDWDKLRAARGMTDQGREERVRQILGDFLELHQEAIRNVRGSDKPPDEQAALLASLTDSLAKTMSALSRAAPKLSELGIALEVLTALADFARTHHPKGAAAILEILQPFGAELAKKYG
ncbi:MAG: DUF1804 family protein [Magnetococcales bacterium]|nr:DUF1804 family protein [Magnetococcales bacterium]